MRLTCLVCMSVNFQMSLAQIFMQLNSFGKNNFDRMFLAMYSLKLI